tara:strand:+ start:2554 stop:3474 length:921 start_codon:yes stop_codon:yes gene_type:complete
LEKNKLYIHLGYPRTGTTFIQECIFSKSNQINYLGKPFDQKLKFLINEFHGSKFTTDKNLKLKELILKKLDKKKVNILSHEAFLNPFRNKNVNIYEKLGIFKNLFEEYCDVYFFLFLRKNSDFIRSFLNHFNHKILDDNFYNDFKNFKIDDLLIKYKNFFDNFKFHQNYLKIIQVNKDTKIFLFEDVFNDEQTFKFFLKDLSNYLGHKIEAKFPQKKTNSEDYFKSLSGIHHLKAGLKTFIKNKNVILMIKNIFKGIYIMYRFKKKRALSQNLFFENEKIIKDYYKNDLLKFDKHILDKMKKYQYF